MSGRRDLHAGANQSTQLPKFDHVVLLSFLSIAATVIASGSRAGDESQASCSTPSESPLPAATAYVTPAAMDACTAASTVLLAGPPRLMFATAGPVLSCLCLVTQSRPARTPEYDPLPSQSRTRTAMSLTALATPWAAPPMVPPRCVPWPSQSPPSRPNAC